MRPPVGHAWELDDADKAEDFIRNLARRLDQHWPGVAASILEGLDWPPFRRVTRNVKRWRMPVWPCDGSQLA